MKRFFEAFSREGGPGGALDREEMAERKIIQQIIADYEEAMGELGDSGQAIVDFGRRAFLTGGREGNDMKQAFVELAAKKGKFEDVIAGFSGMYNQEGELQEEIQSRFNSLGYTDADVKKMFSEYSGRTVKQFASAYLGLHRQSIESHGGKQSGLEAGPEDQRRMRALAVMSEMAKKQGHLEQVTSVKDYNTGKYYVMSERERRDEIVGEAKKMGMREFLKKIAPTVFQKRMWGPLRDNDGNIQEGQFGFSPDASAPEPDSFEFEMFIRLLSGQNIPELRQMQSRVPDELVGRYFDTSGNFLSEERALQTGFVNSTDTDGHQVSARQNLISDFKRLVSYNSIVVEALYNMKYSGKADAKPDNGYPWESGYVDKVPPERESEFRDYLDTAVPYQAITKVARDFGINTENGIVITSLLDIRKILCNTAHAARKGMVSQQGVAAIAANMGKAVEWDESRISPRAEARIQALEQQRDSIDHEVLTSTTLTDQERKQKLEAKSEIEHRIQEVQKTAQGFWSADVQGKPEQQYESNAQEIEKLLQKMAYNDCKTDIRSSVESLVDEDGVTILDRSIAEEKEKVEQELAEQTDIEHGEYKSRLHKAEADGRDKANEKIDAFIEALLGIGEKQTL